MGFFRNTIALAFVATLLFYFATVGEMQENQQWIVIGIMVVLGLVFILPERRFRTACTAIESKTVEADSATSTEAVGRCNRNDTIRANQDDVAQRA